MMKKKAISVLLALCMVLSLLPGTALAAEDGAEVLSPVLEDEETPEEFQPDEDPPDKLPEETDSVPTLYASTTKYPVTGGNLHFDPATGAITDCDAGVTNAVIPDSIDGVPVTSIGEGAFRKRSGLTSVTIPNSVTSIGSSAFLSCSGLTSVTIPNSVTQIGAWAFCDCSYLTSVTIPKSVTQIGVGAFSDCTSLAAIQVDSDNQAYTAVDGVIFNKSMTQLVEYIEGNRGSSYTIPSGVTSIGDYAFNDCIGLASVTIPNSVTSIGSSAFYGCIWLASVTIPNSVTSIGSSAFFDCRKLTSVTIPNSVTSIGSFVFSSCSGLTSVTIPSSVTSIDRSAFSGCRGLTSVTIPSGVTSIGDYAFNNCIWLASVTIPKSVTSIGNYAFYGCGRKLKDVYYAGTEADWAKISIGSVNDALKAATIHYNTTSGHSTLPTNLTLTISENKKGPGNPKDEYQLSSGAAVALGGVTSQTGKDGAYKIDNFKDMTSLTVEKDNFAAVTRTQDQLKDHPQVFLEPVEAGYPTVSAVWLDGVDVRHAEKNVYILGMDPVTITADVLWDSEKGTGTIKLIQGSKAAEFSGNTLTMTLKGNVIL